MEIWPAPAGHRSGFASEKVRPRHKVDLSELISAGWLEPGITLVPRRKKFVGSFATLLPDGRIDLSGVIYSSTSEAAKTIVGGPANGWAFFMFDRAL